MLRSGLDRAFARFARTGEPGALARVFDGSAAELYRLGYHLLGDRHAAEDLVQQTFVVAIEQAKGFDGSRRVLPWLCGILTNRALHQRRQARQRAAAAEGRDVAERAVDPAAEASAREAEAVVAATVRLLDEPYRQVLLLHLVHELQPKDIAEALARPDATVRTQLARGLELLRKALPAGIAGLAAGQVPPPLRLGSVRAAVLARAADLAGTAATGVAAAIAFTGAFAMKKVLFVLAAVLAVVFAWPWLVPADPAPAGTVDASARSPAPVVAHTPIAAPTPALGDAERTAPPVMHDASTASLELRVLWADGTPAADVAVRCRPRPLDVETWLRVARTGDDGAVCFADLPPGAANALTGRGASADVELAAGAMQHATITLPQGIDVRGRVVDLDDRPIAGATVWMSVARNSDDSEPVAVTGADGAFYIRGAGQDFVVTATAPGLGCAKEAWVDKSEIVLTLRRAPGVLAGTVVDPRGRPVAGARVLLGQTMTQPGGVHERLLGRVIGEDLWPSRFVRTDADGRFRCEGLPVIPWPLWVGAPGFAPAWEEVPLRADGETVVTIRMTGGATVRGRVTDAKEQPIVGEQVWVFPSQRPVPHVLIGAGVRVVGAPLWARMFTKTDANGCYELTHVMTGNLQLGTWHGGGNARTECVLADGETFVWDAFLTSNDVGQRLHGVLVDEDGNPLENWALDVGEPCDPAQIGVRKGGVFRTNPVPPGEHRLFAQPRDPMIAAPVDLGTFDVANCPLRVVVPREHVPTARLRGRVLGPAATPDARCRVWVIPADARRTRFAACDADGKYEAGPVQNGSYRLKVESPAFGEIAIGTFEVVDDRETDVGTFQVPTPGTLVVTIVDALGKRRPDAWVTARPIGDTNRGSRMEHREGIARGNLPAGRWHVATRERTPMAAMEVDVRAGETTDVRLVVPDGVPFVLRVPPAARERGRLTARWLTADGTLLREHTVYEDAEGTEEPMSAPPGRYTLEVTDARGSKTSATFDLRASKPPQVVELPL